MQRLLAKRDIPGGEIENSELQTACHCSYSSTSTFPFREKYFGNSLNSRQLKRKMRSVNYSRLYRFYVENFREISLLSLIVTEHLLSTFRLCTWIFSRDNEGSFLHTGTTLLERVGLQDLEGW